MKKRIDKPRTTFTREFKIEAVRLLDRGDKPAAALAMELGVRRNQLYKWKEEIDARGEAAFPGQGRRNGQGAQDEVAQLRRELARVKEENEILKKAAAYFARELK
jgi:transposase-like protein